MSDENNPFKILAEDSAPIQHGTTTNEADKSGDLDVRIKKLIDSSRVFLFMKGIPDAPQCGFSANVVGLLNHIKVEFSTFDILSDFEIREGVKQFSNWPTYPQLYVNGQLVGGNDIITEMYENGELQEVMK